MTLTPDTERHNTNRAEQQHLLSPKELEDLRCLSPSRSGEGKIARHKNVQGHVARSSDATQLSLPGI